MGTCRDLGVRVAQLRAQLEEARCLAAEADQAHLAAKDREHEAELAEAKSASERRVQEAEAARSEAAEARARAEGAAEQLRTELAGLKQAHEANL